jgi:hypothetical protein
MTFKHTKGTMTVEACVYPAPGQMFKGAVKITTMRDKKTIEQLTGRGCGRPMNTPAKAMELAEIAARRLVGLEIL